MLIGKVFKTLKNRDKTNSKLTKALELARCSLSPTPTLEPKHVLKPAMTGSAKKSIESYTATNPSPKALSAALTTIYSLQPTKKTTDFSPTPTTLAASQT